MTKEQEQVVRNASGFLRKIVAEDVDACAAVLNAEAETLEGDVKKGTFLLKTALQAVCVGIEALIKELDEIKK